MAPLQSVFSVMSHFTSLSAAFLNRLCLVPGCGPCVALALRLWAAFFPFGALFFCFALLLSQPLFSSRFLSPLFPSLFPSSLNQQLSHPVLELEPFAADRISRHCGKRQGEGGEHGTQHNQEGGN